MAHLLPVPMLQLCGYEGSPYDRVFRARVDDRWWSIATNGQAALLVAADGDPPDLPDFNGNVERGLGVDPYEPTLWVDWHDMQSWLHDRLADEVCRDCDGRPTKPGMAPCNWCDGEGFWTFMDVCAFAGGLVDRNLLARYLAPVFAPRLIVKPATARPMLVRSSSDEWRAYVMPVRDDGENCRSVDWFPRGWLEVA